MQPSLKRHSPWLNWNRSLGGSPFPIWQTCSLEALPPILSVRELEQLGYKFVVAPVETLMLSAKGIQELCRARMTEGRVDALAKEAMSFSELKTLLGVDRFLDMRKEVI